MAGLGKKQTTFKEAEDDKMKRKEGGVSVERIQKQG